ncbi:hypothetical protein KKH43_06590 [Patescibacteria group bacterium]|nr:hypothetical protein [Patescibacteria group bacterium]
MSGILTSTYVDSILSENLVNVKPEVFIETGTYRGDTISELLGKFRKMHTIELSKKWYKKTSKRFLNNKVVTCHQGDSSRVLSDVLKTMHEPVLFYLDAHYAGKHTARGVEDVPLLDELKIIAKRTYQDIVIIDDAHIIGEKGIYGSNDNPEYPPMHLDWTHISREKIYRIMQKESKVIWKEKEDRIVLYTNRGLV